MIYFRFEIPRHPTGEVCAYCSPVYAGTHGNCSPNERGVYYNDRLGFGYGVTDTVLPDGCTEVTKAEVDKALADAPKSVSDLKALPDYASVQTIRGIPADIWYGERLTKRRAIEDAMHPKVGITEKGKLVDGPGAMASKTVIDEQITYCHRDMRPVVKLTLYNDYTLDIGNIHGLRLTPGGDIPNINIGCKGSSGRMHYVNALTGEVLNG